jgi:hypothetical protein
MTDETKLEILNYVVNNIEPTAPNNDEIFLEQNEISRDEWVDFIPSSWTGFRYEGMVAGNELTTNLTVLYGGYIDTNNNSYGIITLVDENFIPVKTIYEYSSGAKLRYIQYMKQAEDGTFYFIDDNVFSYGNQQNVENSQKRFVMTNNFTLINQLSGDYDVILRKSYIFGDNYKNFYCKNMYKDEYSSSYIFFGVGTDTDTHSVFRRLRIIGLKIQVGMSNEWTMYYDDTDNATTFGSAIAVFDNENIKFRCLCVSVYVSHRTIECVSKTFTGNVERNSITTFSYRPYIDDRDYKKQSVFINYDEVYFVQNNQRWGGSTADNKYIGLYKYNFNTQITTTIYEKSLGSYVYCNIEAIYIDKCNTDLYIQYNTNINNDGTKADYYFQRLVNDEWKPILIETQKNFKFDQRIIYIKSNFNLLQVYLYTTTPNEDNWFQYLIKEDYNKFNYNGTSYIGYDTLVSKKGQIYSKNKLVFARNLYNKNVYQNTCVSTIQVPNNYLNGIQLDLKKLISNTNFDICNENNITNKNIYEMMFVNYINTITCIDEDTNTIYGNTATYINENINTGTKTNYDNTKMSKVRINFTTPQIQLIDWTWNVDHYETSFTIYTDEIPTSIEFISNDETTTYITKELEFEQNKYYTISQKLRIE